MQYDVFISYSSKDSATAQAICHELEDNHIQCWMAPRDIPIGSKYATVITDAIISCKAVVLVFSERSAISPWVESEINIAFSNRKPIIPYKIDKAHLEDYSEFYLMLNNRHWIEAYPDFKTRFAELVEVVSKIVSPNAKKNLVKQGETEQAKADVLTAKPSSKKISTSESSPPFSYKKLLLSAVVCILTVLAIIFDSTTQQTEILPPSGRQNDTGQQQTAQPQQQSQPAKPLQHVKEEPAAPATISFYVTTTPSGASVYVDGKKVGTTPIEDKEIPRGSHKVKLSKEGYEDKTFTREFGDKSVVLNETLTENPKPQPQVQAQQATASPVSSSSSTPTTGKINGHEYVDLGLSVKWGTCNVGASSPSDYGNYYSWGETNTKSFYYGSNCKNWEKSMGSIAGNVSYDAARANWGSMWRLPTGAEFQELIDKCTWAWTSQGGHNGYRVTGKNGKSIFLPAAGFRYFTSLYDEGSNGDYWSSTLDSSRSGWAYCLDFNSGHYYCCSTYDRGYGYMVRPVSE